MVQMAILTSFLDIIDLEYIKILQASFQQHQSLDSKLGTVMQVIYSLKLL